MTLRLLRGLALALVLLPASARAWPDLFGLGGGPPPAPAEAPAPAPAPMSPGPRRTAPARPFVIGRDNLGFANLAGAITLGGMAGNCYTMAAVSRLFWEAAGYRPEERVSPALDLRDLARALRSPGFPDPGFPVRGFADLYQLSRPPPGVSPEAWMEGWTRYRAGLADAPPAGPTPLNLDGLVALYQAITTIHYLHYVQFQGEHLVASAVARATEGEAAVPRVMAATLARARAELAAGRLPMVCIFNPRPEVFFGHVVLAYRMEEVPAGPGQAGYTDLFVYDSNAQYAGSRVLPEGETDEVALRVHPDGRLELRAVGAASGENRPLGLYAGDDWFEDPEATVLVVLDDPEADAGLRRRLADQLEDAGEHAGTLLAAGDLLGRLTTRAPEDSSLAEDLAAFARQLERVRARAAGREPRPLPEGAGVPEIDAYLARHADAAARAFLPRALPPGLALEDVALRLDPADPNRAELTSTLTLARTRETDAVVAAVRAGALAGDAELADLVAGVARAFEGQVVRLRTRLGIRKQRAGGGRVGPYAPVPELLAGHLVVGDLEPGAFDLAGRGLRLEVAEEPIDGFVTWLLREQGVLGEPFGFEYELPLAGTRRGQAVVEGVEVDCRGPFWFATRGSLALRVRHRAFAGVVSNSRGVALREGRARLVLRFATTPRRNALEVDGGVFGEHDISAGISFLGIGRGAVVDALGGLLGAAFRRLDEELDELLEEELAPYVELVGPGPRFRDLEVDSEELSADVLPFEVAVEETLARVLGFRAGEVPARLTGVDFTEDRMRVDLALE